ncbi:MAG: xanthine dehydrogenase family protein molybdopterin-binding subunit, partial [Chloroflexi bacterium]|nr:xanthine dehydrogenase family protein molybdopterin-binding subunit [Chloroflexota bacterium]
MARLEKSRIEFEGRVYEREVVVEEGGPPAWGADEQFQVVGQGLPRVDAAQRVTGRAIYTADVALPGMLYARVLRCPSPHAVLKRLDTTRAASLPGVRAVLCAENLPEVEWPGGDYLFNPVLRFQGAEVAAVAADDEDVAADALALIEAEYELLPFVLDPETALRPGAPPVHPEGNLAGGAPRRYARGDAQAALARAPVVVEGTFRTPTALHNALEPHGAVARWDQEGLTVWESTQGVFEARAQLAAALGLPLAQVRVIQQFMGGGFGAKQGASKASVIAALLSRRAGHPVKLMLDRRAENLAAGNRHATIQHLQVGAQEDGRLVALRARIVVQVGAYGEPMEVDGPVRELYACPNVETEVLAAFTNTGPTAAFRAPGYTEGMFGLERLMDELARRLKLDPLELRLRNDAERDPASGRPYSTKGLREAYLTGAELIGWPRRAARQAKQHGTVRRGLGMASQIWGGAGAPPAYALVRLNADGSADVITGAQDIGTGTRTGLTQLAAEELGLPLEEIRVELGDTRAAPYAPTSAGSMTLSSVGPAVRAAAADARQQVEALAAQMLEVDRRDLERRDGVFRVRGTQRQLSLAQVLARLGNFSIVGRGARGPNDPRYTLRTFGAQFAEVEVD